MNTLDKCDLFFPFSENPKQCKAYAVSFYLKSLPHMSKEFYAFVNLLIAMVPC